MLLLLLRLLRSSNSARQQSIASNLYIHRFPLQNCGIYFCFRCLKDITDVGYDHFGSNSCVLFEDAEVEAWNAQQFNPLQVHWLLLD